MKAFVVKRRIKVGDGQVTVPLKVYEDPEQAAEFAAGNHDAMEAIMSHRIVDAHGKVVMTVSQYLGQLGVFGFKPELDMVETEGSLIQVAHKVPKIA